MWLNEEMKMFILLTDSRSQVLVDGDEEESERVGELGAVALFSCCSSRTFQNNTATRALECFPESEHSE